MADNKIQVLLEVDDRGTASLQKFGRTVAQTGKDGERAFTGMSTASRTLATNVTALLASFGATQAIGGLIRVADTWTQLEGRLKLVTKSSAELAAVQSQLYTSANTVRSSYESHADLYARIARSMHMHNLTVEQTIGFTEAVSRSMIVSGGTTQEASSFMIQFGQALASNRLQGEEFRAMLESNSRAVQVLTDYLGVDIETLRKMAKEGELTADVLYNAFSASSKKLQAEAEAMPKTVAQAMEHLKNAGKLLVAETNKSSEATKTLAGTIDDLAVSVEDSRDELVAMFSDMATGVINAATEAGKLVPVINSIYGASSQLLGLNAGEWGIIGFALLRGGPQAAALTGAILTVNGALGELGLGLGNLGAAWKGYAESMQNIGDVLSGKRDANTGAWIDQQAVKIGDLETKLANLQQQAADTGETFTTGFEVSLGGSSAATDKLNAEIAETQAQLDAARTASASFQDGIKSAGVDVNDMARYTGELSLETKGAAAEMGTLTPKIGGAGKAADGATKSKKALAAAAKAEREAVAQVAVAMRNYADAAEPGTKATEKWAKGATGAAKALAALNEHYETAGLSEYDALMVQLNREFAKGKAAIQTYDKAVAEANTKVATASKEYAAAEAKLAEYRKQLDGTSLSAEQLQDKLGTAAEVVEKKREALDAAEAAARKLETANGGVAATEEDLRKRIFETNKSLEQQRQAYIDAATKGDDFFAGVAAGAMEMQDSMMTLGRVGYEVFNELREGWRDSFFAVMSGDLDDLGDIWDSTLQAMLRAFSDFLADLVMAWAAAGIAEMFGFKIPGIGGGMGSIGSAIGASLGSGSGAAGSWLGAAGYQPGAGTGWTSYAGPALATAGGAYALYDAANKASKGEMNAGTAIEAAGGAYLAYTGGSALWSKLGGAAAPIIQDMVVPASSEIMIAASDLTLLGPQTGGIGNAIAGGGAQSGGLLGMGATATAFTGFGAFVAGLGALAASGATPWQSITSPTLGIGVDMPIHGSYGESDARRRASTLLDIESGLYDPTAGGGGDTIGMSSLAEFDLKPIIEDAKGLLDILANQWGDGLAALALDLDGSVAATDRMIDAAAGYDVSMSTSAELNRLAAEAVGGSSTAMESLRTTLQGLGLTEEQTETAMLGLIAATGSTTGKVQSLAAVLQSQGMSAADAQATAQTLVSAMQSQQTAASGAASAIGGMIGKINDLSNTPLNIRVNVGVQERPYRIENHNPYAVHASGGIFSSPTLIPSIRGTRHLVGEAGAEAITPLHAGPKTLELMDAKLDALLSGGRPVQHVINLDGRTIATATLPYVDAHVAGKASRGALTRRTVF